MKNALKEIIDSENKKRPLGDGAIEKLLKAKGYAVARRTVAKYREQMGFPNSRGRIERRAPKP